MGVKIFGNPNTVNYNLFNILYDKFILRKETEKEYLKKFYKDGYFKTEVVSKDLVDLINDQIIAPQQSTIDPKTKKHIFHTIIDNRMKKNKLSIKSVKKNHNKIMSIKKKSIIKKKSLPMKRNTRKVKIKYYKCNTRNTKRKI